MTGVQVSVCIPAYRRPRELAEALASVADQSFARYEVVVGDDSGDLEPVVAAAGDSRIRYLRNDPRLGMVGNWTRVLDAARGRYRMLLMDDDRLAPEFLASTTAVLDADPSVGVAYTNNTFATATEEVVRSCTLAGGRYQPYLPVLLAHCPGVAISGALMREELWSHVQPLPDLLCADLVMYVRAALHGWAFHYVDRPLMRYRVHAGQLTGQPERFRSDIVEGWSLFEFDDPACEAQRRHHLSTALVNRAAERLRTGDLGGARDDLDRARSLGAGGRRLRALAALARRPALRPAASAAWAALRQVRPAGPAFYSCICQREPALAPPSGARG